MAQPKARTMIERAGFRDPEASNPNHDAIVMWIEDNIEAILQEVFPYQEWNLNLVKKSREDVSDAVKISKETLYKKLSQVRERDAGIRHSAETEKILSDALKIFGGEISNVRSIEEIDLETRIAEVSQWDDLGGLPEVPSPKAEGGTWELPINHRGIVAAFIDYSVKALIPRLTLNGACEKGRELKSRPSWEIEYDPVKVYFEAKVTIPSQGELFRQLRYYQTYQPGIYVVVSSDDTYAETIRKQGIKFVKCPAPQGKSVSNGQQKLF